MPRSESDVQADKHVVRSRRTGGARDSHGEDTASTTGTSPTEEFVGRVAGEDETEDEVDGAQARAEGSPGAERN